jgi:LuxR family transcriptional regulator, maltose regulon positive regulatory protein
LARDTVTVGVRDLSRRFVASARFRVPELPPAVVERRRLVEPFTSGAAPVSLVVGSPGAGKSAVLSSWVSARPGPTAWLSCDPTDTDPVRFWTALATAIDRCVDGAGVATIEQLDQDGVEGVDLAAGLGEACLSAPDLTIVLDDFHHAGPAPQTFSAFVGALPVGVRLVLASRRDPPIPIGRLRVRGQLLELRDDDLRFTTDEAAELFTRLGFEIGPDDVARLVNLTEGWAAGLHLAALSLSAHIDVDDLVQAFAASDRGVADFLINEVIDAQPPDVADFLMETSILETLSGELCSRVTGRTDSGELLESLHRAHLFVIALDRRSGVYRYHHLFAAFLQARLRMTSVDNLRRAHLAASDAHAAQGDRMRAVRHAMAANDTELAFRHLRELTVAHLDVEGRHEAIDTARAWLREFGATRLPVEPSAVLECCLVLIAVGAPDNVEVWLRRVEQLPLEAGDTAMLSALRGLRALHQGDPETAIALVAQGQAVLGPDAADHAWISRSPVITCQAHLIIGDSAGVAQEVDRARREGLPSPVVDTVRFPGYLSWCELSDGELDDAARHADQAIDAARQAGLDESNLAWCVPRLTRAALFRERDEAQAGSDELAIATEVARSAGRPPTIFLAALESARHALAAGRTDEMRAQLDVARASMPTPTPIVVDQIARLEARVAVDSNHASADARIAGLLPGADRTLLRCRRALADRDAGEAGRLLDSLSGTTLTRRQRVERGVCDARALAARDLAAALVPLQAAVQLAADVGLVRLLIDEGPEVHRLFDALPAEPGLDAFVNRVLSGARHRPVPVRHLDASKLVEPISEREHDVLRFLASRLTFGEISGHLYISVNTLKSHVKAIYRKLDANSRQQAVERARQVGLL